MLRGGNRGPAVEPGRPASSLLYQAVAHAGDLAMPPGEKRLPDQDVETLKAWIEAGASWPDSAGDDGGGPTWWSFRPPIRPEPPPSPRRRPTGCAIPSTTSSWPGSMPRA